MRLLHLAVLQSSIIALDTAKILFLYFPLYSHIRGSLNVGTELASRGHMVWNAVPTSLANDKRLQVPGVKNAVYRSLEKYDPEKLFVDKVIEEFFDTGNAPLHFGTVKEICDLILRDSDFLNNVKNMNLDLIIFSSIILPKMLTIFAYKVDVPFLFMGPFFDPFASRTPFVWSTSPFLIKPWTPKMDFGTRLVNTALNGVFWILDPFSYYNSVGRYVPEKPYISLESLTAKSLIWLIEIEPLLHYPQATLPNVKFIGSLSTSDLKPLPEVYKKFMDEAQDGVVIVSFGSNLKHLPDEISQKFFRAFQQTKYKFIFKTDKTADLGSNILLTKWMPQSDLLAHPNTKLFITHCGANGQNEAFLRGVPMIGFPMFAEQQFNAAKIVYNGFGVKMDILRFTVDELTSNINLVIQNATYATKIRKSAEITKLRQRTPKEEAVYWIEHVLKYGGEHLRSYCQDMPLYQYLNLDVIGLLLLIFHLIVFLLWKLIRWCVKILFCVQREQKRKNE